MGSLWSVLESIFREASNAPAGTEAHTAAMLRGACKYLEAGHAQHLQEIISVSRSQVRLCTHAPAMKLSTACKQPTLDPRSQANLGGTPSRKAQVHAFVRLREQELGPWTLIRRAGLTPPGTESSSACAPASTRRLWRYAVLSSLGQLRVPARAGLLTG